jgi:hypothetical protein
MKSKVNRWPGLAERFWANVNKHGPTQAHMKTCCWEWTGGTRNGYGYIYTDGKLHYAHRISFKLKNGEFPKECLLHKCDYRRCVRSSHLHNGTKLENSRDMVAKGRAATGNRHGMHLHPDRAPRGERCGTHKLTWEKVHSIRSQYPRKTLEQLAVEYGLAVATIHKVVRNKTWKQ